MPAGAALVAVLLDERSPEALTIMLDEVLQTLADAEAAPPTVDASTLPRGVRVPQGTRGGRLPGGQSRSCIDTSRLPARR